ncbi:MAG: peptidylprolyl isomerase [Bacteroidales bacterium]|nr:peptidylprolyl isomerase [Bacteroidales bacterium]
MKRTLIFAAFASLLAAPMASSFAQDDIVDGVAAVVGRNIIKFSDVERSYAQIRLKQGAADAFNNRCAVLENLILSQLLVHKGEIDSVEVTDEEVNQYVDYYLKNDLRNYGSREAIREATGFTYEELKEQYQRMIRNNLLARRVEYQLTEDVTVTPKEVADFFATLPADSLPMMPERYELSEIVIEPQISETERDRVRTQLAELRERVIKGEKFSMLATLYSQDPASAKKGGELGFFSRGDMVADFESAAFALKPGEVSPIVETQYGFHIIQLIERRGNTINARHILLVPQVSPDDLLAARMKLDSIATEIRAGHIAFDEAARTFSTATNAQAGGVAVNPADGTQRFDKAAIDQNYYNVGIQGMDEGEVSNATAFKNDKSRDAYRIVRLNKKYPAHKANLTDDYDNIQNAALADAKQKKMQRWAKRYMETVYVRLSDQYKDCVFRNLR